MRSGLVLMVLLFTSACADYRTPGVSGDPGRMSADTLCYRYAYAKKDPKLKEEIAARGLDCKSILDSQPPIGQSRY